MDASSASGPFTFRGSPPVNPARETARARQSVAGVGQFLAYLAQSPDQAQHFGPGQIAESLLIESVDQAQQRVRRFSAPARQGSETATRVAWIDYPDHQASL